MIKRFLFLGLSALVTTIVVSLIRRVTAFGYRQATGMPPPVD